LATGALSVVHRDLINLALPIPAGVKGHDFWLLKVCYYLKCQRCELNESLQIIRRHDSNTSEWVVNSLVKVNKVDVYLAKIRNSPALDYLEEISMCTALIERIKSVQDDMLCNFQKSILEKSIVALKNKKRIFRRRQELVKSTFLIRKAKAIRMFFSGDYSLFNGFNSFVRDIIR
jgi:hypothetical protein